MTKHILLATAGHLSSCPRLIKEAKLLSSNGFKVTIVYLESVEKVKQSDLRIIQENSDWNIIKMAWQFNWSCIFSFLVYKFFYFFGINSKYIQSSTWLLHRRIESVQADLYIAHHPSLIASVSYAADKYNAKFIYDVEDAFPFLMEGSDLKNYEKSVFEVERKYIPRASLISVASPLYIDLYKSLYEINIEPIVLLNVFDISQNKKVSEYKDRVDPSKLSFYWMSQTVGLDRGLQDLFTALNNFNSNSFELHIRGNCSQGVRNELLNLIIDKSICKNIYFHELVDVTELEIRNSEHDIGFALEPPISLNRDLCISNKLLDYIRSGLMVIATRTQGHSFIANQAKDSIRLYTSGNIMELNNILQDLLADKDSVKRFKELNLTLAMEQFNWKSNSSVWLKSVKELLND